MALPSEATFNVNPFEVLFRELVSIRAEIAALKQAQSNPKIEKFLTAKEVCEALSISPPTRIALAKSGKLIPQRIGRKILYTESAVQQALANYSKWTRD